MKAAWLFLVLLPLCAENFEVAAIKPGMEGAGSGFRMPADGQFVADNVTLDQLVMVAYGVNTYQVAGGPGWAKSERLTIRAKGTGDGPFTRAQHLAMLQGLLAERFQLRIRLGTQELSAYALTVKDGSKLKESAPGAKATEITGASSGPVNGDERNRGAYQFLGHTLPSFVVRLSFHMRARGDSTPILDRTGLTGTYDIVLPRARETTGVQDEPSVFSVIQEVGLRLEKGKFPVEAITIESAQRPVFD